MKHTRTKLAIAGVVASIIWATEASSVTLTRYQMSQPLSVQQLQAAPAAVAPREPSRPLKKITGGASNGGGANATVNQSLLNHLSLNRASRPATPLQGLNPAQQRDLAKLAASMPMQNDGLSINFERRNYTPTYLRFSTAAPNHALRGVADSGEISARHFLRNYRDLLRIEDSDSELALKRQQTDDQGNQHFVYQQQVNDVPVWGSELMVHQRSDGSTYLFNGRYQPSIKIDTTPRLSAAEAEQQVLQHLGVTDLRSLSTELVVYPDSKLAARLAYKIDTLVDVGSRWLYFIDAQSGKTLHRINYTQQNMVNASGNNVQGNSVNFRAWADGNTYVMLNTEIPILDNNPDPISNPAAKGDVMILDALNTTDRFRYSTSNAVNSDWDSAAVSAMENAVKVHDYYLNTFNRSSIDGNGKNITLIIHFDNQLNNAFWNGELMVYGDGDGQIFSQLAGCLDVAAHEMTHGVVQYSAGLKYENQSGALNEAYADIFGTMVDRDDWTVGEDCTVAAPGYLRSLSDPASGFRSQPTKMSEYQNLPNTSEGDNGGVHINNSIPSHAAYLIAEGLTSKNLGTSIGRDKMEQIFYRALTTYLTASSQFIDARHATLQSAEDLYGVNSAEVTAVGLAWDAVEVTDNGTPVPDQGAPTDTDPVSGADIMIYVYSNPNGNNEIYAQLMNDPLEYDGNLDLSVVNDFSTNPYARSALYTGAQGTNLFYVSDSFDVYSIDLSSLGSGDDYQITNSGDIWSIAMSPNGRFFSYTTTSGTDNNIHIIDIETSTEVAYPITPPNYQEGGNGANTGSVYYADSMSFDYSSQYIIFDALNCLSTESSSCDNDGGIRYWSIGIMDATDGSIFYPMGNQSPAVDVGYPVFAQNNNYVIAMDTIDYSADPAMPRSQVLSIDFEQQVMAVIHDFGTDSVPHMGIPSFWGDDQHITVLLPDATNGTRAVRKTLNTNGDSRWAAGQSIEETINPYAPTMPLMHREGQRTTTGSVSVSVSQVNFGSVNLGESAQQTVILSNNGNSDVDIVSIQLDSNDFHHNGTNLLLPRGASVKFTLSFSPTTTGARTGTLVINSNANTATVALTGTATDNSNTGGGNTGGGNTGGGNTGGTDSAGGAGSMGVDLAILLIAFAVGLGRRLAKVNTVSLR